RFECVKPGGAFYLFPRITKVLEATGIASSGDFSQMLLDEARVALTAGEGFDAPGFLRISYATSLDRLREGTTRILDFVQKHERKAASVRGRVPPSFGLHLTGRRHCRRPVRPSGRILPRDLRHGRHEKRRSRGSR